jgi:bacterioferritin
MNTAKVIDKLNDILRWEYAGLVQYLQHSFIVQDIWRDVFSDRFRDSANEALKHARLIGDKIVALGGVPTVERAEVKQSANLQEMLQYDLELERMQVKLYDEALKMVDDNAPLRVLLEDIILEEQEGVDELEKILNQKDLAIGAQPKGAKKAG